MKKSIQTEVNSIVNKHTDGTYKLNEVLFKVVVIGFSIGLLVVIDTVVYGFLTR